MSDMTTGDWFEDGTFEDALAHFDAQATEATRGRLPGGLTFVRPTPTFSLDVIVSADAPSMGQRLANLSRLVAH